MAVPGWGGSRCAFLVDLVRDHNVAIEESLERLGDQRRHALLKALGDERVGDPDDESILCRLETKGALEPRVVVITRDFELEGA